MTYKTNINGMSGKAYIDDILQSEGPLEDQAVVAPDIIQSYAGKLPELLLDFWRNHGVGTLSKGRLRLCVPTDFAGLLSQIFHADDEFSHKDCHVVGYGVFGDLVVWSERHGVVRAALHSSELQCDGLLRPEDKKDANVEAMFSILGDPFEALELEDDDGKPLFAGTKRKLGLPKRGEAYGFVPALAMGGAATLENLKIVPALEHFLFLAQLDQFTLMDYLGSPPGPVRKIG